MLGSCCHLQYWCSMLKGQSSSVYFTMNPEPPSTSKTISTLEDVDLSTPNRPADSKSRMQPATISRSSTRYIQSVLGNLEREIITLKILVIGDPGVGKTAFINYYVGGKFQDNYRQTIGVDFFHKVIRLKNGQLVRLQLWDIADRDANGCLLLFDLTNPVSFAHVEEWKEELNRHCMLPSGEEIPCLLLGNKCDLISDEVYANEVQKLLQRQSFIGFRHVSAKDGANVASSLEYLTDVMIAKWQPQTSSLANERTEEPTSLVHLQPRRISTPTSSQTQVIVEKGGSCC